MKITLKLFDLVEKRVGSSDLTIESKGPTSCKNVIEQFRAKYPVVQDVLGKCLIEHNGQFVYRDISLRDGDTLALLPPFAANAK